MQRVLVYLGILCIVYRYTFANEEPTAVGIDNTDTDKPSNLSPSTSTVQSSSSGSTTTEKTESITAPIDPIYIPSSDQESTVITDTETIDNDAVLEPPHSTETDILLSSPTLPSIPTLSPSETDTSSSTEIVDSPLQTIYRYSYCSYRGFLHALRDILFPEFRHNATLLANSYGKFDKGFPDESTEDSHLRYAIKENILFFADQFNVPEFYYHYPDTFRTLAAILVGILLFSILFCIKGITECLTRACFSILFKMTKNTLFDDTEITENNGDNVFSRMWNGPVEYEFDPRLTEDQRKAFREHQQRIANQLLQATTDTKKTQ